MTKAWEIVMNYSRAVKAQADASNALMEAHAPLVALIQRHGPIIFEDEVYALHDDSLRITDAPKDAWHLDDNPPPPETPPCCP